MSLEAQCHRCQGIFRNFTQVVMRGDQTYCVQCAAAIAKGAPAKMYDDALPPSCLLDAPAGPVPEADIARWA